MKKNILLFLFSILIIAGFSQSYNMQTDTITLSCTTNDTLYDSGGNGASYNNNEIFFFTVCPSSPTEAVGFEFNSANFGDGDYVCVFDGPDALSPLLDCYNNVNPVLLNKTTRATVSNVSRCLTFQLYS